MPSGLLPTSMLVWPADIAAGGAAALWSAADALPGSPMTSINIVTAVAGASRACRAERAAHEPIFTAMTSRAPGLTRYIRGHGQAVPYLGDAAVTPRLAEEICGAESILSYLDRGRDSRSEPDGRPARRD